ncbi:DUF6912 family protein [Natronoglycomyces albus]|uniref:Uncharacterized protein n=1 Tax=Natronoglycomyces albus TaxID=2811108 RepID=A0A895XFU2_9ACTN|nr:hypothetical protein [Natronoglycomyces albus]QSB04721.1 hypothetical protein JQS30_13220 [Natronoglycomyces albus]
MTRIYLPGTLASLRELEAGTLLREADADALPMAAIAHAVTPQLRQFVGEGTNEEDLEFVAFTRASVGALDLLSRQANQRRLRVVVAADVPGEAIAVLAESEGDSRVRVSGEIPARKVAAIHVDSADASEDVAAAAAAWPQAMEGDEEATAIVEALEAHHLEWYHPAELAEILKRFEN